MRNPEFEFSPTERLYCRCYDRLVFDSRSERLQLPVGDLLHHVLRHGVHLVRASFYSRIAHAEANAELCNSCRGAVRLILYLADAMAQSPPTNWQLYAYVGSIVAGPIIYVRLPANRFDSLYRRNC